MLPIPPDRFLSNALQNGEELKIVNPLSVPIEKQPKRDLGE
jgi:hypothetical protein